MTPLTMTSATRPQTIQPSGSPASTIVDDLRDEQRLGQARERADDREHGDPDEHGPVLEEEGQQLAERRPRAGAPPLPRCGEKGLRRVRRGGLRVAHVLFLVAR